MTPTPTRPTATRVFRRAPSAAPAKSRSRPFWFRPRRAIFTSWPAAKGDTPSARPTPSTTRPSTASTLRSRSWGMVRLRRGPGLTGDHLQPAASGARLRPPMRKGSSVEQVLAGDIGGTNARLRLYDRTGEKVRHEAVLPSVGAPSLAAIVGGYLIERRAHVRSAVLGIAGPVVNGISQVTNLPWVIDERKLARQLKIPRVSLMNDLAAVAIGCTRLGPSARTVLAKGRPPKGVNNIAVIAAGTGLGEALLVWDRDHYVPCQTEGGHADFAPTSELEVDLYHFLKRRLAIA